MRHSVEAVTNNELVTKIRQDETAAEAALYEKYSARAYFKALGAVSGH